MAWNTKLAVWMLDVAEGLFRRGCTFAEVGALIKVSRNTVSTWIEEGSEPTCKDELLVEFAQRALSARAEYKGEAREVWREHCLVDPKAMAVEMKALFPEEYDRGTHKTVDVTVNQRKPLADYRGLTDEQMRLKAAWEDVEEQLAAKATRGA